VTQPPDPPHRGGPGLGRCLLVGAGAWGVAGTLVWLAAPLLPRTTGEVAGSGFVDRLVGLCAAATLLCGLWLAVVATVVVLDAARSRGPRRLPGCPRAVQRWLLAACGAALAAGLAAPATGADRRPEHPPAVRVQPLQGLPLPDRAVAGRSVPLAGRVVAVRAGDCLWTIAARSLPEHADDAEITRRWQQIFALNRAVIGTDPDLIRPGLQLRLPRS
jgi:hypothetical protein